MASGAFVDSTTSWLRHEKTELETKIKHLPTKNTEAIWEKSASESRSRHLADKASKLEKENDDLSRQLGDEEMSGSNVFGYARSVRSRRHAKVGTVDYEDLS